MNSKLVVKVLKSNSVKIHDDNSITLLRATVHSQTNSRPGGVCAYQYVGHYNLISFYEYLLPQSTTGRPASIRTGSLNSAQILSLFFLFSYPTFMIAFVGLVGSVTEYTSGLINVKQTAQLN